MEALKTFFSFIIVNLVNKGIRQFLITNAYQRNALRKNSFIVTLVQHFKKNHKNVKCHNFQFHDLKFSQGSYFGLSRYCGH